MVASVPSRLPHFCIVDKAKDHDSKKMDELLASLKEGDIGILDRAYNAFAALHRCHERGCFFVVREKDRMLTEVVKSVPEDELPKNILSDETIILTGMRTRTEYPEKLRRVTAHVLPSLTVSG